MEMLALTSKILYDKELLDAKKNLKEKDNLLVQKSSPKIKFDCIFEYYKLINKIKNELINGLSEIDFDNFGIVNFETFIKDLLLKNISINNNHWLNDVIKVYLDSLKGVFDIVSLEDSTKIINLIGSTFCKTFLEQDGVIDKIIFIKCFNCNEYCNQTVYMGESLCHDCYSKIL